MGRSRPPTRFITTTEATQILKVSKAQVLAWAERGLLERTYFGKMRRYRLDEVEGLSRVLPRGGPFDFGSFAAKADLAYAKSSTLERRVDALYDLFGLNRNTLDLQESKVRGLQEKVEEALLETEQPSVEVVREWAGTLFAVDEAYLSLIEQYVGTKEPWKRLLDLGYKLTVEAPFQLFDERPEYRPAYGYLQAARSQLRSVAYFYCRGHRTGSMADRLFGKPDEVTTRIMGLLYPH
jgi:hypothetical protein